MDMTLEQQGGYRNLLDEATLRGGALPDDERMLAKASGDALAWDRLRPVILLARFTLTADGWRNTTLDEVLAKSDRIRGTRSTAGKAGAEARYGKPVANALANDIAKHMLSVPVPVPGSGSEREHEKIARLRTGGGPIIGRNTHLDHAACDTTLSYCVPSAVHRKLADSLAPRHGGDRDAAKDALQAWYPTVWATLPDGFTMGDAFRFWQGRFDAKFATPEAGGGPLDRSMLNTTVEQDTAAVLELLHRDQRKPR